MMHQHSVSQKNLRADLGGPPDNRLSELAALLPFIDTNPTQAIARMLQHALTALGGRFAVYSRFDIERGLILTQQGCQLPRDYRRSGQLDGRVCYEELFGSDRSVALFEDLGSTGYVTTDPDVSQYHLKAYIGVPVSLDKRIIGSLSVYDDRCAVFHPDDGHLLCVLARFIAHASERLRIKKQLARDRIHHKLLSKTSAKAICTRDESFLEYCLQTIGRSLKLDVACILWYDPVTKDFNPHFSRWTPAGITRNMSSANLHLNVFPLVRQVLHTRQPVYSTDTSAIADEPTALFLQQQKVASLLMMPICHQEKVHGLFVMQMCHGIRKWEVENMDSLMAIMAIIAQWKEGWSISRVLNEMQALNEQILRLSPMAIYRIDLSAQRFVKVNETMCQATGFSEQELLSMKPIDLLTPSSREVYLERAADMAAGRQVSSELDFQIRTKSGRIEWGRFYVRHLHADGKIWGADVVAHYITDQKQIEDELAKYRIQLEEQVFERTQELSQINQKLREEIVRGQNSAHELHLKTGRLEELNTAMRVLLDKRDEDRLRIEENIRVNLVQLIEPYLDLLGKSGLNPSQQQYLDVIRLNLNEVAGSPMPELSAKYYIFSPTELQVANLIRKGRTTKEMACLLNLSPRTVESYRNNVRKKLGLKNTKVNLKTYLSSRE
jgi:PAS domain S-box-containing protein